MSPSGSDSQVVSLPQGGGALSGIGETFSPDLFTGTGNFTVPIALPPGRGGFRPQLNLVYSTGNGNGPFGLGWSVSIPGVSRKTAFGVPRYNDRDPALRDGERRDVFILSGSEDLVPVGGSDPAAVRYRPRTEGLFADIVRYFDGANDYWRVRTKDGLTSVYGGTVVAGREAVVRRPGSPEIFAWKLTETKDTFGNLIRYEYGEDSGEQDGHRWSQPLLRYIRYIDYGAPSANTFLANVEFSYEEDRRPDAFSDYRAGFEIRTTKRCRSIRIFTATADGTTHDVREYRFTYRTDPWNGVSLLQRIDIVGYDDQGNAYDDEDPGGASPRQLPPLTFGYTPFAPERRRFEDLSTGTLPGRGLGAPELALVDLHGSGLPDILEMNGAVRYWRNLGQGRFDLPRQMRAAPAHALADPGVQLIDANGDGRTDLLVTNGALAGFFPLTHEAAWDVASFQRYDTAPGFSFEDPDVRLVDLDGDGYTDILRSGSRLECFFNDPDPRRAWKRTHFAVRRSLDVFPDVTFSDPRVRLADLNGDGLQDIVLVHDGNVEYWPNLGHGRWGARLSMRSSPRFPSNYDARRILIGDVDGDGVADILYVDHDKVMLWLNQSGNAWSAPIAVHGTPPTANDDDVRLVDLHGTGVSGVLWSRDVVSSGRHRLMFLDFTGGLKPYVMNLMDNHMGAVTRVEYRPSTSYYLEDQKSPATRWRTPLPFPVQVVARIEVIDEISRGKLTSEFRYHHGYWDGAEREFRGFGMVEQIDSEVFQAYHAPGLEEDSNAFEGVPRGEFSKPTLKKTWFHQGPVGEEFGDWAEADYSSEYWAGDPQLLDHSAGVDAFLRTYSDRANGLPSPRNRRIKRDALRALRGSVLRSELYGLDGADRLIEGERMERRPYSVTEHAYDLREIDPPAPADADRPRVFYPHAVAERSTQWERGVDPMTQFIFTGHSDDRDQFDAFGRPCRRTTVAMPRLVSRQRDIVAAIVGTVRPDETRVLATQTRTSYATPAGGTYIHDRVAQLKTYELTNPPPGPDAALDSVRMALVKQRLAAEEVRGRFDALASGAVRPIAHQLHHYDGLDFEGLPAGQLGARGALTRSETLVFTARVLDDVYGTARPDYLDGPASPVGTVPAGFGTRIGYRRQSAVSGSYEAGYYADTMRQRVSPRGMTLAIQDPLGNQTDIQYDAHDLLPLQVTDAKGLTRTATYNDRLLLVESLVDPNGNSTHVSYNAIGLVRSYFAVGLDTNGNATLGGTTAAPDVSFTYNFLNFELNQGPIYVHKTSRIHHAADNLSNEVIESREYSDGFSRLIQVRMQAEEHMFGAAGDDVGLPATAGSPTTAATAVAGGGRVVVSAWQVFDNKGRAVEKYEPFFGQGWTFDDGAAAKRGEHVRLFYDPRGQVVRTINADGSEQRVIPGAPADPLRLEIAEGDIDAVPIGLNPTAWERYTYDANDLGTTGAPAAHRFTPSNTVADCLGRSICTVTRNGVTPGTDWFVSRSLFDVRGNLREITDALGRRAFRYQYDLLNRALSVESIDAGRRASIVDARGMVIESSDSKGSLTRRTYDSLNRATGLWARDTAAGTFTLRESIQYGDDGNRAAAARHNTLGKPVKHYDEAGVLEMTDYDFKGNLLEKRRRSVRDASLATWQADWSQPSADSDLETTTYQTSHRYDALNRLVEVTCPQDVDGKRKVLTPRYNRSGTLESVQVDGQTYVERIAYDARGQRRLIAYGNGVMTRYAYDPRTFRLVRLRTEHFAAPHSGTLSFQPGGAVLQDFNYGYDLAGNLTSVDDRTPNGGVRDGTPQSANQLLRQFTYDPLYRLLTATGRACKDIGAPRAVPDDVRCGAFVAGSPSASQTNAPDLTERYTETFAYDPAGNVLTLQYAAPSGSWSRTFGMGDVPPSQFRTAPNNRLTTVDISPGAGSQSYRFDDNGNLTRQNGDQHHRWDHANRMIGYEVKTSATASPSVEARYLYGADGMRVKKWVRKQSGEVTTATYVGGVFEHHHLKSAAVDKTNDVVHVMDDQRRIAIVRAGAALDGRDRSPQVQYHLGDHLGGSHIVVGGGTHDASTFVNREEYFPYGETSFGSFGRKRYRYSGKERDEETGWYYFGARYFAPHAGRWVTPDPLGVASGNNLFVYSRNNPLTYIDPTGLQEKKPDAGSSKPDAGGTDTKVPPRESILVVVRAVTPVSDGKPTPTSDTRYHRDRVYEVQRGDFILYDVMEVEKGSNTASSNPKQGHSAVVSGWDTSKVFKHDGQWAILAEHLYVYEALPAIDSGKTTRTGEYDPSEFNKEFPFVHIQPSQDLFKPAPTGENKKSTWGHKDFVHDIRRPPTPEQIKEPGSGFAIPAVASYSFFGDWRTSDESGMNCSEFVLEAYVRNGLSETSLPAGFKASGPDTLMNWGTSTLVPPPQQTPPRGSVAAPPQR